MIKFNRFFVCFLCAGVITTYLPQSLADQYGDKTSAIAAMETVQSQAPCSTGQKINEKALRTIGNFGSSLMEIPKNIINTTNDSNLFYGLTGGVAKGGVNTLGRLGTAIVDLLTLPVPTKAIAYPNYAWEDFNKDTQYGDVLRLDTCPPDSEAAVATPDPSAVKPRPAIIVPSRQMLDNSGDYNPDTNTKLDTIFKKQMMK